MNLAKNRCRTPDPLIDEIRAIRQALADTCGNDVDKLCDEFQRVGTAYRRQLQSRAKRPSTKRMTPPTTRKTRKKPRMQ